MKNELIINDVNIMLQIFQDCKDLEKDIEKFMSKIKYKKIKNNL